MPVKAKRRPVDTGFLLTMIGQSHILKNIFLVRSRFLKQGNVPPRFKERTCCQSSFPGSDASGKGKLFQSPWIVPRGLPLTMLDKDGRKRLKEIEKELRDLEKEFKKMELRPCQNDAELIAKEKDLKAYMDRILDLEKQRDRFSFPVRVIEEDAGDE